MEVFHLTLEQMLMMFSLIAVGFALRRWARMPDGVDTVLSKMETMVFLPALSLYTQLTRCTVETFSEHYVLILYGLAIIACSVALAYPLSRLFVPVREGTFEEDYRRNVYKYACTFGNYGFMGNFIVLGVLGSEMHFRYSLLTLCVTLVNSTWGMFILMPRGKNVSLRDNLKKALLSPLIIALTTGVFLGLTGLSRFVPSFVLSALDAASKCQGPVAMLLAGYVIGGYDLREMLSVKRVYAAAALRLVALPALCMVIMRLLGVSRDIMTLALILLATPLGLNTIVYPAAFGGETKTGASMAMISHVLCVVTIPMMYLLFIELL